MSDLDRAFEATNDLVKRGKLSGEECGVFYVQMLKDGVDTATVVKYAKQAASLLSREVRLEIFETIADKRGNQ